MSDQNQLGATPNVFNRRATGENDALGPLGQLVIGDRWVGDSGFNLMVVPTPGQAQFLVMISPLFETHEFTAVAAPVPNRSAMHGTEQIGAVKYSQTVAENRSKNILHEETGMWLNQTRGSLEQDPSGYGVQQVDADTAAMYIAPRPIMRSGTIPHGNTIHATGNATVYASPLSGDVQPFIAIDNFTHDGGKLAFLPSFVDGSDPTELQLVFRAQIAASLALIGETRYTVDDFINPIGMLNQAATMLKAVTALAVTTAGDSGGVLNIPYERAFAGPHDFICTFLIEEVYTTPLTPVSGPAQDEVPTFFQLQYLQSIPLLFPKGYNGKDVLFPHWNINTLIAI